ncbi:hypothetical protein J3E73DRAFT_428573 [Bipolaris maydis]|nr:hypothetical protein J3E73DRAFT_428573 [Bipolaris maydis]
MALSRVTPTQDSAWSSLLPFSKYLHEDLLSEYHSLDEFLAESPHSATFWFFQSRDAFISQNRFRKWSREVLDDYVLLLAMSGYVQRKDCFFISHFWRERQNPDPDGQTLRLHQAQIGPQEWLYIWVDWTCLPQHPRSGPEETYFSHGLRTMTGYHLTSFGGIEKTPDIELFLQHIDEMIEKGVQKTLEKHRYHCYEDRDRQYLTSWLELLVLFRRLKIDLVFLIYPGLLELHRYEGSLVYLGNKHTFTPFPKWTALTRISKQTLETSWIGTAQDSSRDLPLKA